MENLVILIYLLIIRINMTDFLMLSNQTSNNVSLEEIKWQNYEEKQYLYFSRNTVLQVFVVCIIKDYL